MSCFSNEHICKICGSYIVKEKHKKLHEEWHDEIDAKFASIYKTQAEHQPVIDQHQILGSTGPRQGEWEFYD